MPQLGLDTHPIAQRLQHDAVPLAQADQLVDLLALVLVVDVQAHEQRYILEADADVGAVVGLDAEGAAEVEGARSGDGAAGDGDAHAGGDGADGDAEAGDEGFEQHVAGAEF